MSEMLNLSFDVNGGKKEYPRPVKIPKGESSWKIMPPFGTNNNRVLFHEYFIHWGFTGPTGTVIPVQCSKSSEGYCPMCVKVDEQYKMLDRAKAEGNEAKIAEINEFLKSNRAQRSYVYNMADRDNSIKMVSIPKTAHEELFALIRKTVETKKIDPTSPESGVWVKFTRTGEGLTTKYNVELSSKTVTMAGGEIADVLDRTPLSAELTAQIKAQLATGNSGPLFDIHMLYPKTTSNEIRAYMNGNSASFSNNVTSSQVNAAPATSVAASVAVESVRSQTVQAQPQPSQPQDEAQAAPSVSANSEIERLRARLLQSQVKG